MTMIFKIIAVGLLHLAFYASYPETGQFGNYYLGISLLVWSVFIMLINTGSKLVSMASGAAGSLMNLAAFALMALAIAATMPQQDKISVLEKIKTGNYPDRDTLSASMQRFGVGLGREAATEVKSLDKELGKAVKKLKKD